MPGTQAKKTERLEARLTRKQKRAIAQAAAIRGLSTTDFVVTSAQAAATETIKETQVLVLRGDAQAAFVDAILNPPEPVAAAKAAAREYQQRAE